MLPSIDISPFEDVLPLTGGPEVDTLYLRASVSNDWGSSAATRAGVKSSEHFHESIGCFGYYMTNDEMNIVKDIYKEVKNGIRENCGVSPKLFNNTKATKSPDWALISEYYWYSSPSREALNQWIYAYAPYVDDMVGLTVNPTGKYLYPSFDYIVPDDVSEQTDLMFAKPIDFYPDDPYTLSFQHALSGVRFVTKDIEPGSISKISLKNVYGKGRYDFYNIDANVTVGDESIGIYWESSGEPKSFSQSLSTQLTGSYGQSVTTDECTFMMLPQVLPNDAIIEVVYTPSGSTVPRTLTAKIGGSVWGIGRMHTYFLSYNAAGTHLVVTPMEEFPHDGGEKTFTLSSYTRANGISTPAGWTAQFVNKNSDGTYTAASHPSWLTLSSMSGSGSISGQTLTITATAGTAIQGNEHNTALRTASSKGNSNSPWNLSNASGSDEVQNTANCYVINAPGTYCLPVVYGNAIKNGQTNANAYSTQVVDNSGSAEIYPEDKKTYILSTFKNHLDADITSPWIDQNLNCVSANATLVWMDEQGLVSVESTLRIIGDKKFIVFTVPSSSIKQGNAIVAVRDASGTIMWSWHIWVTDYVPGASTDVDDPMKDKVVQNHSMLHDHYIVMPINLGWADNYTESYPERIAYIKFIQNGTSETEIMEVKQRSYTGLNWSSPYYQWGRKDPMLPALRGLQSENDKPFYVTDSSLNYFVASKTAAVSLGSAIQRPNAFIRDSVHGDWCSTHYSNLWDADFVIDQENTEYTNIKTIYDPSPIGYKVPTYNVFDGFVHDGEYGRGYTNYAYINTPYSSNEDFNANFGFEFFCNCMHGIGQYDETGGTIFFPASGCRSYYSGAVSAVGSTGSFWYAAADCYDESFYLYFYSDDAYPRYSYDRAYGYAVRPVRE